MEKEKTDFDVLKRLWELSRLEQTPTIDQKKEFFELKDEFEQRLEKSLSLEERTRRLARCLKAA
jgi:hypothetical protein